MSTDFVTALAIVGTMLGASVVPALVMALIARWLFPPVRPRPPDDATSPMAEPPS